MIGLCGLAPLISLTIGYLIFYCFIRGKIDDEIEGIKRLVNRLNRDFFYKREMKLKVLIDHCCWRSLRRFNLFNNFKLPK